MKEIALTSQQTKALAKVKKWYGAKRKARRFFLLAGYAGTGKTSLIRFVTRELGLARRDVAFGTFTGKASVVLSEVAGHHARTIHSLIYTPNPNPKSRSRKPWVLDRKALKGKKLVVIDEVSMVDEVMFNDLLSFGVPCLMLGDPFQLPPVSGEDIFDQYKPDMFLEQIHRQALENPIVRFSQDLRNGVELPARGEWISESGGVVIKARNEISSDEWLASDLTLVATNRSRVHLNNWYRRKLGFEAELPEEGERVICLKNQRDLGLNNGMLGSVVSGGELHGTVPDCYSMEVMMDGYESSHELECVEVGAVHAERFRKPDGRYDPSTSAFTFGYAITAHKAQGSQVKRGIVLREWIGENPLRWMYTAMTRFRERVIVGT